MKSLLKVTRQASLGLTLISELAQRHDGGEALSLEDVAEKAGASKKFLEQIAACLRRAGIIEGHRGAAGGYTLARDPQSLTVAEVLDAIEGPHSIDVCTARAPRSSKGQVPSAKGIMEKVQGQVVATLMNTTISDLV